MPIKLIQSDITKLHVDAIVSAANNSLLGGGEIDGSIRHVTGTALLNERIDLGGCETGKAKAVGSYKLPCKYVIHTVGPIWRGGTYGEKALLESCYLEAVKLAVELGCSSIAFPLISAGAYGYPGDLALKVAMDTLAECIADDMIAYVVLYDRSSYRLDVELYGNISLYLAEKLIDATSDFSPASIPKASQRFVFDNSGDFSLKPNKSAPIKGKSVSHCERSISVDELSARLNMLDESFSQMLLRKIDEAGISDSACYRRANIDRKLFSKIRSNSAYKPSKSTAIAFAIALKLNLEETSELLSKAGYALSHSSKFDVIVEYFIQRGNYNIHEINEALFTFDMPLLGV